MSDTYVLVAVDPVGRMRVALTSQPEVPEGWVRSGEIGWVMEPLDVVARHGHDWPT